MVVPVLTAPLCGPGHNRRRCREGCGHWTWSLGQAKGPAALGARTAGPFFRQHRRQGSAGAWERRRGVAPLVPCALVAAPAQVGRTGGLDLWRYGSASNAVVCDGTWGCVRIVLDGRGLRNRFTQGCAFLHFPPVGPGRPRSRPFSWVTGLLSPAVRPHPWNEVPRHTARPVRLIAPASHAWFFRARPWLARTSPPTKRSARRSRAVRVKGTRTQMRPRHSSSSVIASAVPGLPRASL
jgi:hypothetical protein